MNSKHQIRHSNNNDLFIQNKSWPNAGGCTPCDTSPGGLPLLTPALEDKGPPRIHCRIGCTTDKRSEEDKIQLGNENLLIWMDDDDLEYPHFLVSYVAYITG